MGAPLANTKTGRSRWTIIVWDDPDVRREIERRLKASGKSVASVARDALRDEAGLPPFPDGLDAPDAPSPARGIPK